MRKRRSIRLSSTRQVIALLRQTLQLLRGADKRVATGAVSVCQQQRFAIAQDVAQLLGLAQRVRPALHVVQANDECAGEAKQRILPVLTQLGGLAEGDDGVVQLLLPLVGLTPCLLRLPVDPVEMSLAIAKLGTKPAVVSLKRQRALERLTRRGPLRFTDGGVWRPVVGDDTLDEHQRAIAERTLEDARPELQL